MKEKLSKPELLAFAKGVKPTKHYCWFIARNDSGQAEIVERTLLTNEWTDRDIAILQVQNRGDATYFEKLDVRPLIEAARLKIKEADNSGSQTIQFCVQTVAGYEAICKLHNTKNK
jgi:hypothetical protein